MLVNIPSQRTTETCTVVGEIRDRNRSPEATDLANDGLRHLAAVEDIVAGKDNGTERARQVSPVTGLEQKVHL